MGQFSKRFSKGLTRQEIRFFCILGLIAFSLVGASSKSYTMRAVAPESYQKPQPKAQPAANPKADDDSHTPEDIDFDDDFSVLV